MSNATNSKPNFQRCFTFVQRFSEINAEDATQSNSEIKKLQKRLCCEVKSFPQTHKELKGQKTSL